MKEKLTILEKIMFRVGKCFSKEKKESVKIVGNLKFYKNGILDREEKNLVVDTGLNVIMSRLKDASKNAVSHMGIGTGTTAADHADTALEIQKAARIAATSIIVTANAIEIIATFPGSTHAGAITEAGLFNAATLGEMISRVVFAPYTLGSSDAITVTWTLTLSNS